jgi:hypothetical protein
MKLLNCRFLQISIEEAIKKRVIILENCAGEGTKLFSTLEKLQKPIDASLRDRGRGSEEFASVGRREKKFLLN